MDKAALQKILNYQFSNAKLLQMALTHRSVRSNNNERLEFLGDAILGFTIAQMLFKRYPDFDEGALSRMRSNLVSGKRLAIIARRLQFGPFLILGQGEQKSGGHDRDSILAGAVEALIGAVYLDSDIETAKAFVLNLYDAEAFDHLEDEAQKDPKSLLQEWLQARQFPLPVYTAQTSGKAHEQFFHVVCTVEGLPHKGCGDSTSRRKAEKIAAENYLTYCDKGK